MDSPAEFLTARKAFHAALLDSILTINEKGVIALGTGDIDCVYHFALYKLQETIDELGLEDAAESLKVMVEGNRLKDISDLPLDLAI